LADLLSFEPLLTSDQAAALLFIHPNTLLKWAREERVPHIPLGRRVMFRASALNAWLDSRYTDSAVRAASTEEREAA
jgi:excisionase family DNA binding protein